MANTYMKTSCTALVKRKIQLHTQCLGIENLDVSLITGRRINKQQPWKLAILAAFSS